jgi:hypothetical protein
MSAIKELEQYIEDEGITRISGGVFEEYTASRLIPNEDPDDKELRYRRFQVKPNTTVENYCESLGAMHGVSAEAYAMELMAINNAIKAGKGKKVIGECFKCCKFLLEGEDEDHKCKPEEICNN